MTRPIPSPQQLRAMINYDPETGAATWRKRHDVDNRWNARLVGKPALNKLHPDGYRVGRVMGRDLLLHRVVWAIYHGAWPTGQIDHVNGDKSDNRIKNLRDVCGAENMRNQKRPRNNSSGHIGVYWHCASKRWRAQIMVREKQKYLGSFINIMDAIAARKTAEHLHGFHENHGRAELPIPSGRNEGKSGAAGPYAAPGEQMRAVSAPRSSGRRGSLPVLSEHHFIG